jgi:hemerythrin-like domain-containing protein
LPQHRDDETWVCAKAAQAARFFANDLTSHFKAEEEVLFPAMRDLDGASELIGPLESEHRELEGIAERLAGSSVQDVVAALGEFADLLEKHIRKEERELFPLYEEQIGEELATKVAQAVREFIGEAMRPRDPELLR